MCNSITAFIYRFSPVLKRCDKWQDGPCHKQRILCGIKRPLA